MELLDKFLDAIKLNDDFDDEDDFLDDDDFEDDDFEEEKPKRRFFKKSEDDFDDFDELHERCVKEAKHLNGAITFPSSMRGKKLAELNEED